MKSLHGKQVLNLTLLMIALASTVAMAENQNGGGTSSDRSRNCYYRRGYASGNFLRDFGYCGADRAYGELSALKRFAKKNGGASCVSHGKGMKCEAPTGKSLTLKNLPTRIAAKYLTAKNGVTYPSPAPAPAAAAPAKVAAVLPQPVPVTPQPTASQTSTQSVPYQVQTSYQKSNVDDFSQLLKGYMNSNAGAIKQQSVSQQTAFQDPISTAPYEERGHFIDTSAKADK